MLGFIGKRILAVQDTTGVLVRRDKKFCHPDIEATPCSQLGNSDIKIFFPLNSWDILLSHILLKFRLLHLEHFVSVYIA